MSLLDAAKAIVRLALPDPSMACPCCAAIPCVGQNERGQREAYCLACDWQEVLA